MSTSNCNKENLMREFSHLLSKATHFLSLRKCTDNTLVIGVSDDCLNLFDEEFKNLSEKLKNRGVTIKYA